MSTYTPGPWRDGCEGNLRVYGPDGQGDDSGLIADVFKGRGNARLIAAAPDLLRVLKAALEQTGCDGDLCMYWWHGEAREIIAKAEGRS